VLPADPFGRSRLPGDFTREGRVRLLGEAARSLLEGRLPSVEARLYLAGALLAWLEQGGRLGALERDYLRVTQRERSRLTPQRVYARCASTATDDGEPGTVEADHLPLEPDE